MKSPQNFVRCKPTRDTAYNLELRQMRENSKLIAKNQSVEQRLTKIETEISKILEILNSKK